MTHRQAKGLVLLALAGLLASRTALAVVDLDLWHELALAREIEETGSVPWRDSFSFAPTRPVVVHHEWGAGVVALWLVRLAGGCGILLLKLALMSGVAATCWWNARRGGTGMLTAGGCGAVAILLGDYGFSTVRAHMYSFLFAAILLGWFQGDRMGRRRWLAGALVLFPVWINLHGGALVGAGLLGAHWLEQFLRRQPHRHLLLAGLGLVPLAALNPWGFEYHAYLGRAILMPRPQIDEWQPLWAAGQQHHLLAMTVSLLIAWLALRDGRWRTTPGLLVLLATGLAALKANRFLPFYAIAFVSTVPQPLSRSELGRDLRRWWIRWRPMIVLSSVMAGPWLGFRAAQLEPWNLRVPGSAVAGAGRHLIYPVGAVDCLAGQKFAGNVWVPFSWGSYVMWKLAPHVKVSIDSRYEVAYPVEREQEDEQFYSAAPGWSDLLTRYPVDVVLLPADSRVAEPMRQLPGWKLFYSDAGSLMFARDQLALRPQLSPGPSPDGVFP